MRNFGTNLKVLVMAYKKSILYFSRPGDVNTDEVLKQAKERADELAITHIVVASTRGRTGLKALQVFEGCNVVVVTHATGLREPGKQDLPEATGSEIRARGGRILTATHAFSGVDRAIEKKFGTSYPARIIAQTLKLFGEGMKVCIEIAAMASDAGMIPADRDVIVIAGTDKGADTAVVIKPANSHNLFDMVIKEIIAKPNNL